MQCQRCGAFVTQQMPSCPQCGLLLRPPTAQRSKNGVAGWIVAAVLGGLLLVAVTVGAVLIVLGGDDNEPATDEPTPTAPSSQTTATEPVESPSQTPSSEETETADDSESATSKPATEAFGPGDVREQPPGLFCRDLKSLGYSYVASVDYWRQNGQPNQMDADRNGIPCETVYPASDVQAYWGMDSVAQSYQGVETQPSGLYCRDLYALGYSYSQAVDYWFIWDLPARMDEDLNGIPCETVYPAADVNYFWY